MKRTPSRLAYVFQCEGCHAHHLQPVGRAVEQGASRRYTAPFGPPVGTLCQICNQRFQMGGMRCFCMTTFFFTHLISCCKGKQKNNIQKCHATHACTRAAGFELTLLGTLNTSSFDKKNSPCLCACFYSGPIWAGPCHNADALRWLATHLQQVCMRVHVRSRARVHALVRVCVRVHVYHYSYHHGI